MSPTPSWLTHCGGEGLPIPLPSPYHTPLTTSPPSVTLCVFSSCSRVARWLQDAMGIVWEGFSSVVIGLSCSPGDDLPVSLQNDVLVRLGQPPQDRDSCHGWDAAGDPGAGQHPVANR